MEINLRTWSIEITDDSLQRVEKDSTDDDEQEDDAEPQISKCEFTDAMKTVWLFLQQNSLEEARLKMNETEEVLTAF